MSTLVLQAASLCDFLPPVNRNISPNQTLQGLNVVGDLALTAFASFEARELMQFDASPGDQACQIRAFALCVMDREAIDLGLDKKKIEGFFPVALERLVAREAEKQPIFDEEAELKEVTKPLGLERTAALEGLTKKNPEWGKIRQEYDAKFRPFTLRKGELKAQLQSFDRETNRILREMAEQTILSGEASFLFRAYLVNLVKTPKVFLNKHGDQDVKDWTSMEALKNRVDQPWEECYTQVCNIAKRALVRQSIQLVQGLPGALLKPMLQQAVEVTGKERELPCYFVVRFLFQRAAALKIPVLVKVRNAFADPMNPSSFTAKRLFLGNQNGELFSAESADRNQSAIVVECRSRISPEEITNQIFWPRLLGVPEVSIMEMIRYNAAQHKQYTDQKNSRPFFERVPGLSEEKITRLEERRQRAVELGFSEKNSTLCCIEHIFADILKNQITEERL